MNIEILVNNISYMLELDTFKFLIKNSNEQYVEFSFSFSDEWDKDYFIKNLSTQNIEIKIDKKLNIQMSLQHFYVDNEIKIITILLSKIQQGKEENNYE